MSESVASRWPRSRELIRRRPDEARRARVDRDPAGDLRAERMAAEDDRERVVAEFTPREGDHDGHAVAEQARARRAVTRQPPEEELDVESHDVVAGAREPLGEILVRSPETDVVADEEDERLAGRRRDGRWIKEKRERPERRLARRIRRGRRPEARGENREEQHDRRGCEHGGSYPRPSRRDGVRAECLHECMKLAGRCGERVWRESLARRSAMD